MPALGRRQRPPAPVLTLLYDILGLAKKSFTFGLT